MKVQIKEITFLVSPIFSIRSSHVEVSEDVTAKSQCNSAYTWNAYIGNRASTASRFEYFSSKLKEKPIENYGFVSINGTRKTAIIEIGLDDDIFENLKYSLAAFGPQNCMIEADVSFSDFVDDVMGGRGAVLSCGSLMYLKHCSS